MKEWEHFSRVVGGYENAVFIKPLRAVSAEFSFFAPTEVG